MIQPPCKDCKERHEDCWSSCPKFAEFRTLKDAEKAEHDRWLEYHYDQRYKIWKRWRKDLRGRDRDKR